VKILLYIQLFKHLKVVFLNVDVPLLISLNFLA